MSTETHICHLSTARINYVPLDNETKFDITIKTGYGLGKTFAPTWDMVMNSKKGKISWVEYRIKYLDLMRERYYQDKTPFLELINYEYPVICCFCQDTHDTTRHCHRYILVEILQKIAEFNKLKLIYDGEKE